jgi:2-polyprenyl-3-methyl-5-hydroxy-6-metoxy-1,4-benzoquinol methylase
MFHNRNLLRNEVTKTFCDHKIIAKRYLDMGCGNGGLTLSIAKAINANEVCGVDIDCKLLRKLPQPIKGICFDFEKLANSRLPFDQEYFDVITAIEFIEHLSCGDELVQEAFRLLTPRGYLLVSSPNLGSLLNRFLLLMGYQPMYTAPSKYYHIGTRRISRKFPVSEYGHKNLYTLRALSDLLQIYNFEIIATIGCQSTYDPFSFLPAAHLPSLAPNMIVLSRKA